ncbi:SDR family NAD(P)-dependent oxidoreductase [Streptomyces sp. NPDC047061]|uniref:SDR family NAD(P)-dependent oxidoreductase n=1 Tax=Streptomyces sp. NPDC047061 TaxID=3154605 RepID=UPI0033D5CBA9
MADHTQAVVITGASEGLGRATAMLLAEQGYRVFGTTLDEAESDDLSAATGGRVTPIVMDITDDAQVEAMARTVEEQIGDQGLFALISNAGILVPGPMEIVSMEGIRRQFDVNVFGHVATIKALLPALRRGHGRIVEIGSLTGHVALPYKGILAGSKFAMEGLMDLLRRELLPWSIPITIVRAGKMRTNALPKAARNQQALIDGLTPEQDALYGESLRRFAKADLEAADGGVDPKDVAAQIAGLLADPNPPTRVLTDPADQKILDLVDSLPDQEADQKIAHMMGVL